MGMAATHPLQVQTYIPRSRAARAAEGVAICLLRSQHDFASLLVRLSLAADVLQLDRDTDADVVVIGGGITGLTTAYLLAAAGRSVVLLERGRCAEIDTGHTSAHLTMVTDTRLTELVERFGRDPRAGGVGRGPGRDRADRRDRLRARNRLRVQMGGRLPARADRRPTPATAERVSREDAALACELGFDATFMTTVPFVGGPGIRFHEQARFHPRRYLAGVAAALERRAVDASSSTARRRNSATHPLAVKANGHWVTCQDIVMATHNPLVG